MRILTVLILLLLAPVTMAGMTASLAQAQESKKPEGDALTIFTRAPCDMFPKMVDTIKKYKEELFRDDEY